MQAMCSALWFDCTYVGVGWQRLKTLRGFLPQEVVGFGGQHAGVCLHGCIVDAATSLWVVRDAMWYHCKDLVLLMSQRSSMFLAGCECLLVTEQ